MKTKRSLLVIAIIACMVISLSPNLIVAKTQVDEIPIGSLAPMAITPGIDCNLAAELAVKEINDAGGVICGGTAYNLKLFKESTSGTTGFPDPSSAALSYTKLRDEYEVVSMIGGFRTEVMQALQLGGHVDIPFIGVGATVPLISPYYWRAMPGNGTGLFYVMASFYAWTLGPHYGVQNITIFREDNQWAVKMARSLHSALPLYARWTQQFCGDAATTNPALYVENDIAVSVEATYDAVYAALKASYEKHAEKPNALLTIFSGPVGKYATEAWAQLNKELVADGKDPIIMAGSNVESQIETIWDATEGAPYGEIVMQTSPDLALTNTTESFRAAYKAFTGKSASYTAWGAYDAIYIIKEALERAYAGTTAYNPATASEDIQAELINTDWYGPRGRIKFTNERGPQVGVDEYGYYIVIPGAGALYNNASVHDTYSPSALLPPYALGETTAEGGIYNTSGEPTWNWPAAMFKQWQEGGEQVTIYGGTAFPDTLAYNNAYWLAFADPAMCQYIAMGEPYETYGLWPFLVPFVGDSPSANPKLPPSYTNWSPTRCFTKWAHYVAQWKALTGDPDFDVAHDNFFDNASDYYSTYGHYPDNMSLALNWTIFDPSNHGWVEEPITSTSTGTETTGPGTVTATATATATKVTTVTVPGFVLPLIFLVLTSLVLLFRRNKRKKRYKR
ncbi:MAG: hypothetical protein ACFFB5_19585 [Promethearchaeota archaeon]